MEEGLHAQKTNPQPQKTRRLPSFFSLSCKKYQFLLSLQLKNSILYLLFRHVASACNHRSRIWFISMYSMPLRSCKLMDPHFQREVACSESNFQREKVSSDTPGGLLRSNLAPVTYEGSTMLRITFNNVYRQYSRERKCCSPVSRERKSHTDSEQSRILPGLDVSPPVNL